MRTRATSSPSLFDRARWALAPAALAAVAGCGGSSPYAGYCEHVAACLVSAGDVASSDEQTAEQNCENGADEASGGVTPTQSQLSCLETVSCSDIVTCSTTDDCSALASACQ